jgi:anti-sigma regulatory factor (Ser/Thr protein kinase)
VTTATILKSSIPRTPEGSRVARRLLADGLREHIPPLTLADTQLVASEMFNHAFIYGQGEIELRVTLGEDCICIEVCDEGADPSAGPSDHGNGMGFGLDGLQIVEQIAEEAGLRETTDPPGRYLWAKLSRLG